MWLSDSISNVITESNSEPKQSTPWQKTTLKPPSARRKAITWLAFQKGEPKVKREKYKSFSFMSELVNTEEVQLWRWLQVTPVQLTQTIAAITEHASAVKLIKLADRQWQRHTQTIRSPENAEFTLFLLLRQTKKLTHLLREQQRGVAERVQTGHSSCGGRTSETEAHLHVAPPVGTSMSWLPGPGPRFKVSSLKPRTFRRGTSSLL